MADKKAELVIKFEGVSAAEANQAAAALRDILLDRAGDEAQVRLEKERLDTQDAGSTLVLILGSSSVVAVAQGLSLFISRFKERIVIRTPEGAEVIATGVAARNIDAAAVAKALREHIPQ